VGEHGGIVTEWVVVWVVLVAPSQDGHMLKARYGASGKGVSRPAVKMVPSYNFP
jgi:hypothetical protein